MFDRPYPMDKQAEGIACQQAVMEGHCGQCGFRRQCSTDRDFKFPVFAWCSRRKAEILTEWKKPAQVAQREEGQAPEPASPAAQETPKL